MTTAMAEKVTYRKTGKGEWVAFGPVAAITAGRYVEITKRNGDVDRMMVSSVGRPFAVNGMQMVYGYLGSGATIRTSASPRGRMCDECGERRAVTTAVDLSGITGDVCGTCKRSEGCLSFA